MADIALLVTEQFEKNLERGAPGAGAGGDDSGPGGDGGVGGSEVGGAGAGGSGGDGGTCGLTLCGSACIDTDVTSAHCGECDRACSTQNTTALTCAGGTCSPTCSVGFGDCSADDGTGADDGCETNLRTLAVCGTTCENREACDPLEVCNAGVCGAATGLAELSVPLAAAGDNQRFEAVHDSAPLDLTGASVTARVFAPAATGGELVLYVVDSSGASTGPAEVMALSDLNDGWVDVTTDVHSVAGEFDPASISHVRIEIRGGTSSSWATPATVVYVDSLVSSNGALADTFTGGVTPLTVSATQAVTGSALMTQATLPP